MKINEAIERLETFVERHTSAGYSDLIPALKLGIEALKRRKRESERTSKWADIPLLGETK